MEEGEEKKRKKEREMASNGLPKAGLALLAVVMFCSC
jgi:hypothetical protein